MMITIGLMIMTITLMMLCEQYPSLHLENKTQAGGGRGDFKLQLCLFMIRIVLNHACDDDNEDNDTLLMIMLERRTGWDFRIKL